MAEFSAEQKIFITRLYLEGMHSYMELQRIFEVSYQILHSDQAAQERLGGSTFIKMAV